MTCKAKYYCAVKDDRCHIGTKAEVLAQVGDFELEKTETGYILVEHFHGYAETKNVSFTEFAEKLDRDRFTREEARKWATDYLFKKLPKLGYLVFVQLDTYAQV